MHPDFPFEDRFTIVHEIASRGDLDELKSEFKYLNPTNQVALAHAQDRFGSTPLHEAAIHGHVDIVEWLLDNHVMEIDTKDNAGCTPLHRAIQFGHMNVVKKLIEKGAEMSNAAGGRFKLPEWARINNQPEMAKFLEEYLSSQPL